MRVGNAKLTLGRNLLELPDSSEMLRAGDYAGLRARLAEEGVLLLRGAVPREDAMGARMRILRHIAGKGAVDESRAPLEEAVMAKDEATGRLTKGWCVDAESGGVMEERDDDVDGWREVGNSPEVVRAYNGPGLGRLFDGLFGGGHRAQPAFTWLRMKGRGDSTVEHADYYYFRGNTDLFRGNREGGAGEVAVPAGDENASCAACGQPDGADGLVACGLCGGEWCHAQCAEPAVEAEKGGEWHCARCANTPLDVYTCWVALGRVRYANGMLALVPRTHTLDGYDRPLRRRQLPSEWGGREKDACWQTAEMEAGDVIMFNIKTVHGASVNTSSSFRLSLDTRVVARPLDTRAGPRFAVPAAGKIGFRQAKKRPPQHEAPDAAAATKLDGAAEQPAAKRVRA